MSDMLLQLSVRSCHWRWRSAFVVGMFGTAALMVLGNQPEADEFLRQWAVHAALIALAAVLVLATARGTLELFRLVPHAAGWWAVPAFAVARDTPKTSLRIMGR